MSRKSNNSYKKFVKGNLSDKNKGKRLKELTRPKKNRDKKDDTFIGTLQGNERGFAFVIPSDKQKYPNDFFIPRRALMGALNKDIVRVAKKPGTVDEAYVVEIIERGQKTVVGTFARDRHAGYVLPDDKRFDSDVYIPLPLIGKARQGDKVVAEITSYPSNKMVGGKVIEILGEGGDFYTEELSIIRSYNLYESFPKEVEAAAEDVALKPIVADNREDLRHLLTITIDGEDTRDIDDAVSLEMDGDKFILGVHIADVSHYVKLGGVIDKEAYLRGTSVYFPDMVLPMLPRALSNGACSLNEGEDRYAMSCIMTFDKDGNKLNTKVYNSIINSNHRMTYTKVTAILEGDEDLCREYADIAPMLKDMQRLCLLLEDKRKQSGAVELDVKEAHIYIDESGNIVIPDYKRTISQRIIEQFMVTANESVACLAESKNMPFLYRIHQQPAPEKASNFFTFLRDLGINAKGDINDITPHDFQQVLTTVEDKPFSAVVNRVMLRSMQKARYSEDNIGHFGLASKCYCHFTSPIRRYPDLFVHRVLKCIISGNLDEGKQKYSPIAHTAAIDTSERERTADMAERAVDDLYKVVYMSEHLGEEYMAVISGVTNFGIFAELENTIEGIIRTETLPNDSYEFIESAFMLKGIKHTFKIGDVIKVKVAGCDYGNMRVEFVLVQ
jgi:ribonuclease R